MKTGDHYIMSPTVIADVDGDQQPEVIVASNKVTVIEGDGKVAWSVPVSDDRSASVTRGVSVADLDGDGGLDVAFVTSKGLFRVLRGKDGAPLYEFNAMHVHHRDSILCYHGPLIADLDADGRLDVFFAFGGDVKRKHGAAICLTGFKGTGPGWYMLRHDHRNTGNVRTPLLPEVAASLKGAKRPSAVAKRRGLKPTPSRLKPALRVMRARGPDAEVVVTSVRRVVAAVCRPAVLGVIG